MDKLIPVVVIKDVSKNPSFRGFGRRDFLCAGIVFVFYSLLISFILSDNKGDILSG